MKQQKILTGKEIASFCSQASLLLQAGISPGESIQMMLDDCRSASGKAILSQICDTCNQGAPLHKAMESTHIFPDYALRTIAMGEESGNLDVCMSSLSTYYEKEVFLGEAIRSAVSYPLVMIAMMFTVIFILISRILPIFDRVFEDLGSEMNGFAASLLRLGEKLNRYSVLLLVLLLLLFALYLFFSQTSRGKKSAQKLLRILPFFRSYTESRDCHRIASGLALCLRSGMDAYTSLDTVKAILDHDDMKKKLEFCKEAVQNGSNLSESLINTNLFHQLYSQMLAIGFASGNADMVLSKIADQYEQEADRRMQTFLSVLEPTLVIILSGIVGLILLSVILPLMGIMTSIG